MEKNPEQEMRVQSEEIGFKPEEMNLCGKCGRQNPPTRLDCFYCGGQLEISNEQASLIKPNLRKMEMWEKGFNVIFRTPSEKLDEKRSAEIARLLNFETEIWQKILETGKSLPVARAESEKEAEILQNRLREIDLESLIVSDETLAAEKLPVRLRGLEFAAEKILLRLFNSDEMVSISAANLTLMVTGAIFQKAVESTEKRQRKGEIKILDSTETASDEVLIDIYSRQNRLGWRIMAKGFDFSCLGTEKGILARENMQKLIVRLQTISPEAKFVNDYLSVRELLGQVWEVEQRKDSQGLKRYAFARFDFANIASSNNLQQFTKYSRLQWHLL